MSTSAERIAFIQSNYGFRRLPDGRWQFTDRFAADRSWDHAVITGAREDVHGEARRRWGHFNFEDECRAFEALFK